ncbi:hypothetical protein [Mycolicibacterium gilvum]|uniref:hypothetical protein n=1 Tax=Mycolicibacterium gilvum TaxID=1804 RepID=UPI004045E5BC
MPRHMPKTKRRRKAPKAPDYSALAEQFSRQVAPLPAGWDPSLDIAEMYRHALQRGARA